MNKIRNYLAAICLLILANPSHAYYGISVEATDIDSSQTLFNYEIRTDCSGNCLDTVEGVPVAEFYKTDEFYLPYFSNAGISNISSPSGWSYALEPGNDLFGLGSGAGVIHWFAFEGQELDLYATLSGFQFTSVVTDIMDASFSLGYVHGAYVYGTTSIPASPVPIPAAIWLFVSGLFGLSGLARSRLSS